jgi:hypothetical protein
VSPPAEEIGAPGRGFTLRLRPGGEEALPDELTPHAATALRLLAPVVQPCAVEIVTGCFLRDVFEFARAPADPPGWLVVDRRRRRGLRTAPLHARVESVEEPAIDAAVIESYLRRAESAACAGSSDLVAGWQVLAVTASRVRLLEPAAEALDLRIDGGQVAVPVDRDGDGAWVSGPDDRVGCPIALEMFNGLGELRLRISIRWSPWFDENRPGADLLDECLDELVKVGWGYV